jgi:recombination protein RecT
MSTTALTINQYVNQPSIQGRLREIVGENLGTFTSSLVTIANSNNLLSKADPATVVGAAITAAALKLPLNNSLGYAYIVPYNVSEKDANGNWTKVVKAQFQIGYQGHVQLAMRSGQFLRISNGEVFNGQLKDNNPMEGPTFDWNNKISDDVIGYFGYFKLLNGFTETKYWSIGDIREHGKKYSKSFDKANSEWQQNFSSMALKTVILKLLKFAPKAIDTPEQVAMIEYTSKDQAIIDDSGNAQYIDNPQTAKPANDGSTTNSMVDNILKKVDKDPNKDKENDAHDNIDTITNSEQEFESVAFEETTEESYEGSEVDIEEVAFEEPEPPKSESTNLDLPSEKKDTTFVIPAPEHRDQKVQGEIYVKLRAKGLINEQAIMSKSTDLGLDLSYLGDKFDMGVYLSKAYSKDISALL